MQLKSIIEKYTDNTIIILNVNKNKYLNSYKLNSEIKNICKMYKNSHFVASKYWFDFTYICKRINYVIDSADYHKTFLDVKSLRNLIVRGKPRDTTIKTDYPKGTIPYYFSRIQANINIKNKAENNNITTYPKGTIPYYFTRTLETRQKANNNTIDEVNGTFFRT